VTGAQLARGVGPRELARRVVARVGTEGAWATLALAGELEHSALDERDRRFATELVYGTLRQQLRLERALSIHADLSRSRPPVRAALLVGAYQVLFLRVPAHAAVDDAVAAVRDRFGAKLGGFVNAVLRKLATAGEPPLPSAPMARLAIEYSLPAWLVAELCAQWPGDQVAAAAAGLKHQAPLWIRVNRTRSTPAAVVAALVLEGATAVGSDYDEYALVVRDLGDPGRSPSFRAGLWTVQDLGAQLVGRLVPLVPGMRVLDACAGVGGKTTHLAELGAGAITIDAIDPQASKLTLLAAAAARLGLRGIATHVGTLADFPDQHPYDLVIVDAPCTGAGVLRRHPEAALRLTLDDVTTMVQQQAALLRDAARRVAIGGTLIYAVCTITRAEGPDQIVDFLAAHPGFVAQPPSLPAAVVVCDSLRTWPHRHDADGFFAIALTRRS
jgi:16S rRNA (cytosine967-C5)-methyltransferase